MKSRVRSTTTIGVSGELNGDRAGAQFGYRYSAFENEYDYLMYDNPFRVTDSTSGRAYIGPSGGSVDGPKTGLHSLSPDNTSNMFYVNARSKLGDDAWVNGSLSYNVMKQDEQLMAYTTNTAITSASGAPFDLQDLFLRFTLDSISAIALSQAPHTSRAHPLLTPPIHTYTYF